MKATVPTVLLVPGLRDYVADHWQTLLEAELPNARSVPPLQHDKLSCAARIAALDAALAQIEGPLVLVAHSGGVMITVHWAAARSTQHHQKIQGALLCVPPDLEVEMEAPHPDLATLTANGWLPAPSSRLPFPSILAASRNDSLASYERVAQMADDWGSRLVDLGDVGHLNPASGYGPWPRAKSLLEDLLRDD